MRQGKHGVDAVTRFDFITGVMGAIPPPATCDTAFASEGTIEERKACYYAAPVSNEVTLILGSGTLFDNTAFTSIDTKMIKKIADVLPAKARIRKPCR